MHRMAYRQHLRQYRIYIRSKTPNRHAPNQLDTEQAKISVLECSMAGPICPKTLAHAIELPWPTIDGVTQDHFIDPDH